MFFIQMEILPRISFYTVSFGGGMGTWQGLEGIEKFSENILGLLKFT